MYTNLSKEMVTAHITQAQIAEMLGVRAATVSDKINGKYKFYLDEALKIKKVFFPRFEIEYLFDEETDLPKEA